MPNSGQYRVIINGFEVKAETWDDNFHWDGKGDEVEIRTKVTKLNKNGQVIFEDNPESKLMGDTWRLPGRVQAGSKSDKGGLQTGDAFPSSTPWLRTLPLDKASKAPPMVAWQGPLAQGEDAVVITPTIWEWDPGQNALQSWAKWAADLPKELAAKASDLVGGKLKFLVDAVDLGLAAVVSMDKAGILGNSASRPIGMQKSEQPDKFEYKPKSLVFTYDSVEALLNGNEEPGGSGIGVFSIPFIDDAYYRGHYLLYVQVERVMPTAVLFKTAFEAGDLVPTWKDSVDWSSNVTGYLNHIGPECSIRIGEKAHSGGGALMYSGTAKGGSSTYCYYKSFEVNIPITTETKLSYWLFPQQENGRFVALDFHCTDGTTLRDSPAVDHRGVPMHPKWGHGLNLGIITPSVFNYPSLNEWTQIKCHVGLWLAGKTVDRIWVAYDRPGGAGQYRGYIDDILIINGNLS